MPTDAQRIQTLAAEMEAAKTDIDALAEAVLVIKDQIAALKGKALDTFTYTDPTGKSVVPVQPVTLPRTRGLAGRTC